MVVTKSRLCVSPLKGGEMLSIVLLKNDNNNQPSRQPRYKKCTNFYAKRFGFFFYQMIVYSIADDILKS